MNCGVVGCFFPSCNSIKKPSLSDPKCNSCRAKTVAWSTHLSGAKSDLDNISLFCRFGGQEANPDKAVQYLARDELSAWRDYNIARHRVQKSARKEHLDRPWTVPPSSLITRVDNPHG